MCRRSVLLVSLLFVLQLQQSSSTVDQSCVPSSCGKISNISHPFRLKNDPEHCGDSRYELTCENNVTVASLYSGKYYVQAINYNNFTIRLVDPGVQESNCSSIPLYFLSIYNFTALRLNNNFDPYQADYLFQHIVYMNCSHPVIDAEYVDTASCVNWNSKGHIYAIAGDLLPETLKVDCNVKLVAPTSGLQSSDDYNNIFSNVSYISIHRALAFGFQVSWLKGVCELHCGARGYCRFNYTKEKIRCFSSSYRSPRFCDFLLGRTEICGIWSQLQYYGKTTFQGILIGLLEIVKGQNNRFEHADGYGLGLIIGHYVLPLFVAARYLFGMTLFIVF